MKAVIKDVSLETFISQETLGVGKGIRRESWAGLPKAITWLISALLQNFI